MADIKMALGLDSKGFDRGLANAGRSLGAFAAKMAAAVGVAVGFNSAIQAGRAVEDLSVRLQYLAGDAERGAAALDMARKAAQELPFSLEEISAGLSSIVPISGTFGELETNIQAVADVAAIAGLDFNTTAQQFQRAFAGGAGAADLFRERGVLAMAGFEAGATYSLEETRQKLLEFAAANEGAAQNLNQTLTGALSQLGDAVFNLNVEFGKAFNPKITGFIKAITDAINEQGEGIGELAASISDKLWNAFKTIILGGASILDTLMPIFSFVQEGVNNLISFFNKLPPVMQTLGIIGFIMLGGRGKLIVVAISAVYDTIISMASAVLKTLEDLVNGAIGLLNEAIVGINKIPGVDISPIESVDWGDLEPEAINSKLNDLMGLFTEGFELLGMAATGPVQAQVNNILSAAEAYIAEIEGRAKAVADAAGGATGEGGVTADTVLGNDSDEEQTSWGKFMSGWQSASDKFKENVVDMTRFGEQLFNKMANGFSDAILKFAETGKLSFKDLFRTLMSEIIKMQANKLFLQLFGGGGLLGDFFGDLFKAEGGPVSANKPYIVGERGPELFMPTSAGTIIPNHEMGLGGGSGPTNVTYNINATDAQSFKTMLARDPEYLFAVSQAGARRIPR